MSSSNSKQSFKSRHKFTYSAKTLYTLFVLLFCILSIGIIVSIASYYNNQLVESRYENATEVLSVYDAQLSQNLESVVTYLFQTSEYNTDIAVLNASSDPLTSSVAYARILKSLSESLPAYPQMSGLFFYSPLSDDFIYTMRDNSTYPCAAYIREFLRSKRARIRDESIDYTKWFIHETEGATYLVRFVISGDSITGAWASLEHLTYILENSFQHGASVFYADKSGRIIGDCENFNFSSMQSKKSGSGHYICTDPTTSTHYLTIVKPLDYCDSSMVTFIPLTDSFQLMTPVYSRLIIIILFLIAISVMALLLFKKLLKGPFEALEVSMRSFCDGTAESDLNMPQTSCVEIQQINSIFSRMLHDIRTLKISVYEEQLAKNRFKLQYLKSQLSPHFLVNCLSCFSALVSTCDKKAESREILLKMMQTLSNHLRYTLSSRSSVSLQEEIYYVENYLQLISLRFPGFLHYSINVSQNICDCSVFPMILLMFTENSIKHNMIMGKNLTVWIESRLEEKKGQACVHLTHIDSGNGFSPQVLEDLEKILSNSNEAIPSDGHHIGLYNIVQTLRAIYHDDADIHFSNEEGLGARIDIFIPYTSYNETEAGPCIS